MKRKTAYLGMFLALALICSYVESLIPFTFGIPGAKLGLTNIVVIVMLYCVGAKEACLVSVLRILLAGFMFGNPFSIIYSLSGGFLSFVAMLLLKHTKIFQVKTISVIGGMFHNIGQICVAAAVVENYNLFYYVPILLVAGFATGFIIGCLAEQMIVRLDGRL